MPEEPSFEVKNKITLEQLRREAASDLATCLLCMFIAFESQRTRFLAKNPDWPYKDELEGLLNHLNKNPEQNQRLMILMTQEMGTTIDVLELEALKIYADFKGYEILWN